MIRPANPDALNIVADGDRRSGLRGALECFDHVFVGDVQVDVLLAE